MSTIPTQNPVPSEAAKDLKFNSGKIDEFVTSMKNKYIDRFGQEHFTIEGLRWIAQQAISQFGYITLDSFQKGAEITLPNQVLRDEVTGEYYRWDGALPKVVPIDSTPDSSGGIGVGRWLSVGDSTLRPAVKILSDRSGEIYVTDYLNFSSSFSDALQLAIDNANADDGVGHGNKVILPAGRFKITKRVFIHEKDGLNIVGAGDGATVFVVDNLLSNVEPQHIMDLNGTYRGYQYDTLNAQAIFVITARRITQNVGFERHNGAAWRLKFSDFSTECEDGAVKKVSTFYAPEIGLSSISNITNSGVYSWLICADIYSVNLNSINIKNCVIPVKHGLGDIRRGTSVNLNRCNAFKTEFGWSFGGLGYSSWNNVACDAWADGYVGSEIKHFAYDLDNCQVDMNGCGCESAPSAAFGVLRFTGGSCITTNNCAFIGGRSTAEVYQSFIDGIGTIWDLNNTLISQGASSHLKVKVSNGATVNISSAYKSNVSVGGFVKLTDFITYDEISSVNLLGKFKSLLSLSKTTSSQLSVGGSRVGFDKIDFDTLKLITSTGSDRLPIPYHGDYKVEIFVDCSHQQELVLGLYINDDVVSQLPIKNIYLFSKILKLKKGDIVSIRAPSSLPSPITVNQSTSISILKV